MARVSVTELPPEFAALIEERGWSFVTFVDEDEDGETFDVNLIRKVEALGDGEALIFDVTFGNLPMLPRYIEGWRTFVDLADAMWRDRLADAKAAA